MTEDIFKDIFLKYAFSYRIFIEIHMFLGIQLIKKIDNKSAFS